jgi:hypothetical protein
VYSGGGGGGGVTPKGKSGKSVGRAKYGKGLVYHRGLPLTDSSNYLSNRYGEFM